MNLIHTALAAAILLFAFGPVSAWGACQPEKTKQYGLDFIHTEPAVEATEVGEAALAQSLYVAYQTLAEREIEESLRAKIASAFIVSMTQYNYYGIVFYDATDCELGSAAPLTKQQIDDVLKAWADVPGEDT